MSVVQSTDEGGFSMSVNIQLEDKQVWFNIVSAFEGGSNYWIDSIELDLPKGFQKAKFNGYYDENRISRKTEDWYPEVDDMDDLNELREKKLYIYSSQVPLLGGSVIIKENEGYNHDPVPLNRESLVKGLQVMHDKCRRHFNDMINENGDAITSDVLLQCAVFGDVIYG
tara:strand:+ start:353 stop:859 length:507 start_codon:yes stop_codon:yes gene_type:complete